MTVDKRDIEKFDHNPISPAGASDMQEDSCNDVLDEEYQITIYDEMWAEFLGTAIMLAFGNAVVMQRDLLQVSDNNLVFLTWGVAVTLGVLVSYRTTGALLNPAVMIGFWSIGKFPGKKLLPYTVAQFLGAYVGAAVAYLSYYDNFIGNKNVTTSGTFCTYKRDDISITQAFFCEFIATMLLMIGLCGIIAGKEDAGVYKVAGFIFFLILGLGSAFGANTGYAMNPARDFGPRLFAYTAGFGSEVFTHADHYFWVPLVAPICGSIFGTNLVRTQFGKKKNNTKLLFLDTFIPKSR